MASARGKSVLFTLGAGLGVPFLVLGFVEGALRVLDIGYDPGFFAARTIEGKAVLTENPRFGWRFFPRALARAPLRFSIPREKPPGTVRICVLGGSAAMGDPSPGSGMARLLQAMLEDARPDLRIEVVNCAMTAVNSHVVLPIARDCVKNGADLLVVYLGNNEVVGPFGAGSVFGIPGAGWRISRANVWAKSMRLGQLLDRGIGAVRGRRGEPEAWRGMELFLGTELPRDDPRLRVVYDNFRHNLRDLCAAGTRRGVPVVVSSVGVNLRSCAPFLSRPAAGAGRGGDSAELAYRRGQRLLAEGDTAAAGRELRRALDLDVLRFRADSEIQAVLRELAAGRAAEGIHFVDAAAALAAASPGDLPGHELFDDHVHLNFEGNYIVGRALAETILPLLPAPAGGGVPRGTLPDRDRCAQRIGYGPWKRHATLRTMLGRRAKPPLAGQADAAEWNERVREELERVKIFTQPHHLRKALAAIREQLDLHPGDWMLRADVADLLARTGDPTAALEHRRVLARLYPYSADTHDQLGDALLRVGRREEAIREIREAIRLHPRHFLARNRLGEELVRDGALEEAVLHFRAAVRAHPDFAIALRNLGDALLRLDRPAEALDALRRAVEVRPEMAAAHKKMGDAWTALGRREEALRAYGEALRVNPEYEAARERRERLLEGERPGS